MCWNVILVISAYQEVETGGLKYPNMIYNNSVIFSDSNGVNMADNKL